MNPTDHAPRWAIFEHVTRTQVHGVEETAYTWTAEVDGKPIPGEFSNQQDLDEAIVAALKA